MTAITDRYARLGMANAWRAFDISRGAAVSSLERRLRQLEDRVGDLNLERDSVHLAAELAALEANLDDDARFALIVLILISLAALAQGSTRFPVAGEVARGPMDQMLAALTGSQDAESDRLRCAITEMLEGNRAEKVIGKSDSSRRPLLLLNSFICHERSRRQERRLIDSIALLLKRGRPFDNARAATVVEDIARRPAVVGDRLVEFSNEQLAAVKAAVSSRLGMISGGPGTGKTSIVVAILRAFARLGIDASKIALAAPTGRAAFRMRESVAAALAQVQNPSSEDEALRDAVPDAATVHRLLGYSPDRRAFFHHRNNPLPARVVIVDEGSMLDLAMMERLAGALDISAQMVILGDADQLPSVAAGAVFRDLLPTGKAHPLFASGVRLTHNYRTTSADRAGAAIVSVSRRLNEGDTSLAMESESTIVRRPNAVGLRFEGVEMLQAAGDLEEFLDRWDQEFLTADAEIEELRVREYRLTKGVFSNDDRVLLARIFDYALRARILAVTRVGPNGAEAINAELHRRSVRRAASRRDAIVAGEPVMILRNDYERALFNGDQGVVVNSRDAEGRRASMVVFRRGDEFAAFRLDALRDALELCYATTVHKAQGSEFDIADLVLPERDIPLLTRELLYTAVSRCRRAIAIVGDLQIFAAGILRKAERFSGVAEELMTRLRPEPPRQMELYPR